MPDPDEVIDLTAADDTPRVVAERIRNKRRRVVRRTSDSDVEIIDVRPAANPLSARSSDIEIIDERIVLPESEVNVVEARQLTPEERLAAIRERHARGEHVQVEQNPEPLLIPISSRVADMYAPSNARHRQQRIYNLYDRLMYRTARVHASRTSARASARSADRSATAAGPADSSSFESPMGSSDGVYADLARPETLPLPRPPFFFDTADSILPVPFHPVRSASLGHNERHMGLLDILFGGNAEERNLEERNLEERNLQQALNRSLSETHRQLNVRDVKIPEPPKETHPGFTRSVAQLPPNETVVCIRCGHELGKPRPELSAEASKRSAKVFVRGCGHVYCGECAFMLRDKKQRNRACPMKDHEKVSSKKKNLFVPVFI